MEHPYCIRPLILILREAMKCPRDGSELQTVDVGSVELDKCHHCDGLWLDYGELKTIRNLKLKEIEEEVERRYGNPEVTAGEVDAHMRCPRCGETGRLIRHHISYMQPVEVDRCQECHGIWLDDAELDALLVDKAKMDKEYNNNRVIAFCKALAKRFGG